MAVCAKIATPGEILLEGYKPREYLDKVAGRSIAAIGCEPILHMRDFQRTKAIPDTLVTDIACHTAQNAP